MKKMVSVHTGLTLQSTIKKNFAVPGHVSGLVQLMPNKAKHNRQMQKMHFGWTAYAALRLSVLAGL